MTPLDLVQTFNMLRLAVLAVGWRVEDEDIVHLMKHLENMGIVLAQREKT